MANLSLTTSPPRQRSYDAASAAPSESGLARAIESLNAHLASSLEATGKVRHHSASGD